MPYNSTKRNEVIDRLKSKSYDILIIGGGITGAGIALDAVTRGFSVALMEMQDFAAGTSSRSTKLVHGGLRYLKNFEFNIVRETGLERAVAHRNAPHLVRPEKMLLPLTEDGSYGKSATSFGLWLYDVLAGVKGDDRRRMLNPSQTLEKEPLLREQGLLGSGYYAEYRTDDARLTLEVLKTASQKGADVINYVKVDELLYSEEKVVGAQCKDLEGEKLFSIDAKYVINATGPWVDELREKDKSLTKKRLQLTKGVHIVVPHEKLPVKQSIYFDVSDGRMIFAIPRDEITYIGTTDTYYEGDKVSPDITQEDMQYLLKAVNDMFDEVNLVVEDVESYWSGLRPLIHEEGKDPSEISRGDEVFESDSGLITIAGGKLTGYRLMAKKVVRLVCDRERITRKCKTRRIKLCGGDFKRPKDVMPYVAEISQRLESMRLPTNKAFYLVHHYGTQTEAILELFTTKACTNLVEAEVHFALEYDAVVRLEDFFARRTSKTLFEATQVSQEVELVMPIFQKVLGWSDERCELERLSLETKKFF